MKLNIDLSEFKRFTEKNVKQLKENYDKAIDDSLNELGGRLLNKVIRKTPVRKSIKEKKEGQFLHLSFFYKSKFNSTIFSSSFICFIAFSWIIFATPHYCNYSIF